MEEEIKAFNNRQKQTRNGLKSSKLEDNGEEYIEAPIGECWIRDFVLVFAQDRVAYLNNLKLVSSRQPTLYCTCFNTERDRRQLLCLR
jgi:hypothetical protein